MGNWPKISIVTPSFNQAGFLERTIQSVLSQGYPNLEYIIIDGGSTDTSVEIIKKYEKYLAYWTSEPDRGQADAINKGFLKSTGDILAWQNSDDIYFPNAFFAAAKVFRNHPAASLVFGNIKFVDEGDRECGELRFVPFSRWALIYEGTMLANQAAFWRRELFLTAGPLDVSLRFCMDYEFFLRASLYGQFKFIRRFLGAFRLHRQSKSSALSHIGMREHAEVVRRFKMSTEGARKVRAWKALSTLRRSLYYAIQGDAGYLVRGAIGRRKNSSKRSYSA